MMKQCGCSKNLSCGGCEGVEALTPQPTANRPGLSALHYRIGTHSTFFETMEARLSNFYFESGDAGSNKNYPLAGLKMRLTNDTSIALLSAAATVFDVLTFYQERIANEGFLRTATERRSVLELGRLVGYTPRPGVAASVYLAYTMDDKSEPVEIPLGARAQSVPLPVKSSADAPAPDAPPPAELPQSFETSEKLKARKEWNNLQPRISQPQKITFDNVLTIEIVYFQGTDTKLKPNDSLLFIFEDLQTKQERRVLRRVQTVTPQFDDKRTQVTLQVIPAAALSLLDLIDQVIPLLKDFMLKETIARALRHTRTLQQNIWLGSYRTNDSSLSFLFFRQSLQKLESENDVDNETKIRLYWILGELESLLIPPPPPPRAVVPHTDLNSLFGSLLISPSIQPANGLLLSRTPAKVFNPESDLRIQMMVDFHPEVSDTLYPALSKATISVVQPELQAVYALRVTAPLFGYNAQPITYKIIQDKVVFQDPDDPELHGEQSDQLFLDNAYEQILPSDENKKSYIVIRANASKFVKP